MYHYYRGQANFEKKQFPQAWSDYSEAVRLDSKNFYANYARAELSIAWKLAPSPCRPSAVQDAWRSCELTQWQSPDQINLLAAAYAASGNAQCARRWEEKARELRSAAERKVNANKGGTNTLSPHPSQSTNALKSVTNRRLQNEPNN
jgi:tetratricopeptide (TPR) repeat protein